jgi:Bacterial surface proteins containing Ig-like domains
MPARAGAIGLNKIYAAGVQINKTRRFAMFIQKHRGVLLAAACLVIAAAAACLLFIHPDAMPVEGTDSEAIISSKPDVKVKDIITDSSPESSSSAVSSEPQARGVELGTTSQGSTYTPVTSAPKDAPPADAENTGMPNDGIISVKSITAPDQLTLSPGDSEDINIQIQPQNASDKSVTWKSSDPTIAKVDGTGMVTAVKDGSCSITVKSNDGAAQAHITVTVQEKVTAPATSSQLDKSDNLSE